MLSFHLNGNLKIFKSFLRELHPEFYYFSNDANIIILGSKLTKNLGVTI